MAWASVSLVVWDLWRWVDAESGVENGDQGISG